MKDKKVCLAVLTVLVLVLVAACGAPQATPSLLPPPEAKGTVAPTKPTKEAWAAEWDKMVSQGKTEGKVVIYTTAGSEVRTDVAQAFAKKFDIDAEFVTGKGAELSEKLIRERNAGLYLGDIYMAGPTTILFTLKPQGILDPMKPALILPEVADTSVWYGGKHPFLDKEGVYIFGFRGSVFRPVTINTQLVKPEEIKSYNDLLNPKWKEKIAMADPSIPGAAQSFFTAVGQYIMSYDFLKELAKQRPYIHRDERLVTEWVARGKYAILIGTKPDPIAEFEKAGAPIVSIVPKEGSYIEPGAGTFALINKGPHPNAAKVFVNWLLTKEGQTIYAVAAGIESTRDDVQKNHLDASLLREPGKKYIMGYEDFHAVSAANIRTGKPKEIFGDLIQ